jgi:hypothetical protein
MIAAVLAQFLNLDDLIAESPGVSDMLDWLHITADFESAEILSISVVLTQNQSTTRHPTKRSIAVVVDFFGNCKGADSDCELHNQFCSKQFEFRSCSAITGRGNLPNALNSTFFWNATIRDTAWRRSPIGINGQRTMQPFAKESF